MTSSWQFDTETALSPPAQPGKWESYLTSAWNIGATPNGGYALSPMVRAMQEMAGSHDVPLSMTTHYLRPTTPDSPVSISVEPLKQGRRLSVFRSVLGQRSEAKGESTDRVVCLASFGSLDSTSDGPMFDEIRPDAIPSPDECQDRGALPQGVELPIMSRLDIRLDPASAIADGAQDRPATMRGWIRFGDGRPTDVRALPLFADAFPPSVFSRLGRIGWVPTLELTVHVRARPAPGWIQASFETADLRDGLLIEDGTLWDEEGNLVARSRQLAMLL